MRRGQQRWSSVHIWPKGNSHRFFAETFAPAFCEMHRRSECHRQFFIRYSENGLHFRWRILASPGVHVSSVARIARRLLRQHADTVTFRLTPSCYQRDRHYFGDTVDSLYAELLNERTSQLSIQVLGTLGDRHITRRTLIVAAMLAECAFADRSRRDSGAALLAEALGFAAKGVARLSASFAPVPATFEHLAALRGRLARAVLPVADIITRVRRSHPTSPAAAHALHLLANKSGLGPQMESLAFALALSSVHEDLPEQT